MPASIHISNVSKTYQAQSENQTLVQKLGFRPTLRQPFHAIEKINVKIPKGSFTTIFGPNGSGKSTLFKIIAGLEEPTKGSVKINDQSVDVAKIGFVFQNYRDSMLTWRSAIGNVKLALEARGVPEKDRHELALSYLRKVNMEHIAEKPFYSLSGGQAQLVSIARAFAFQPDVLLMDEPFSALDFQTSLGMMEILSKLWQEESITTLFISHDIDEAVYLADQVMVLNPNPGSMRKMIPVNFERPRPLSLLSDKKFFEVRSKVLQEFRKGMKQ